MRHIWSENFAMVLLLVVDIMCGGSLKKVSRSLLAFYLINVRSFRATIASTSLAIMSFYSRLLMTDLSSIDNLCSM